MIAYSRPSSEWIELAKAHLSKHRGPGPGYGATKVRYMLTADPKQRILLYLL